MTVAEARTLDMATTLTLPNGASILARQALDIDGDKHWIVLCLWSENSVYEPFVTWLVDEGGHAAAGHYFSDIHRAVEDLRKRVDLYSV